MDVDEAGRDGEPGRVELWRLAGLDPPDRGDASVGDRDVGDEAVGTRAVVDGAAADDQIDGHARTDSTVRYAPSRCQRSCARATASWSISKPCPGASSAGSGRRRRRRPSDRQPLGEQLVHRLVAVGQVRDRRRDLSVREEADLALHEGVQVDA